MEQKENEAGNKGEKAVHVSDVLGNRVHQLIENILLGNKGTQGKICWEQGNMDRPGKTSIII